MNVGWNMSPEAYTDVSSGTTVTPVLDSVANSLTFEPTSDTAKLTAGGSDRGTNFLNLNIQAKQLTEHGTWEGHLIQSFHDTGSNSGSLNVAANEDAVSSSTFSDAPATDPGGCGTQQLKSAAAQKCSVPVTSCDLTHKVIACEVNHWVKG